MGHINISAYALAIKYRFAYSEHEYLANLFSQVHHMLGDFVPLLVTSARLAKLRGLLYKVPMIG